MAQFAIVDEGFTTLYTKNTFVPEESHKNHNKEGVSGVESIAKNQTQNNA